MDETAYTIAASLMRYFFVGILFFILISTAISSLRESRRMRKLRQYAGLEVHFIEILEPPCYKGRCFELDGDCVIGSAEDCDICLPESDLKAGHARIITRRGEVFLKTRQRRLCEVNGVKPSACTALCDGDTVWICDVCFVCRKRRNRHMGEMHDE